MKSSEVILTAKRKLPYAKLFEIDALVLKASLHTCKCFAYI